MKRDLILKHEFVEFIPSDLVSNTLYVSIPYGTVSHNCCCGCGYRVVTPLSPRGWTLSFDGESVSLSPSIGNWNFPCQSHYFITRNRVKWAPRWSRAEIDAGREKDRRISDDNQDIDLGLLPASIDDQRPTNWWQILKRWL